jgi:hypothetical protein
MKVRILSATPVDGVALSPDCAPDLPKRIAVSLVAAGIADAEPAAVAYAEKIGPAVPEGLPDYKKELADDAKAAKAEG